MGNPGLGMGNPPLDMHLSCGGRAVLEKVLSISVWLPKKKKKKSKCFCLVAQKKKKKKKKRKEGECLIKTNLYDISYIEVGILILSIYVHIRLLLNCVHVYSIKNFIMLHTSLHTIIN